MLIQVFEDWITKNKHGIGSRSPEKNVLGIWLREVLPNVIRPGRVWPHYSEPDTFSHQTQEGDSLDYWIGDLLGIEGLFL